MGSIKLIWILIVVLINTILVIGHKLQKREDNDDTKWWTRTWWFPIVVVLLALIALSLIASLIWGLMFCLRRQKTLVREGKATTPPSAASSLIPSVAQNSQQPLEQSLPPVKPVENQDLSK